MTFSRSYCAAFAGVPALAAAAWLFVAAALAGESEIPPALPGQPIPETPDIQARIASVLTDRRVTAARREQRLSTPTSLTVRLNLAGGDLFRAIAVGEIAVDSTAPDGQRHAANFHRARSQWSAIANHKPRREPARPANAPDRGFPEVPDETCSRVLEVDFSGNFPPDAWKSEAIGELGGSVQLLLAAPCVPVDLPLAAFRANGDMPVASAELAAAGLEAALANEEETALVFLLRHEFPRAWRLLEIIDADGVKAGGTANISARERNQTEVRVHVKEGVRPGMVARLWVVSEIREIEVDIPRFDWRLP